jgi:hypothetical protein
MYFYRCLSKSGRLLESPHEDLFEAIKECMSQIDNDVWSDVSTYNDETEKFTTVFVPRLVK